MYSPSAPQTSTDIRPMVAACQQNSRESALGRHLQAQDWAHLRPFLHPTPLPAAQVLISQGAGDRTLYFVESGSLSVHFEDAAGRIHLAVVGPGSAVGEGSFFSHLPRNATVQAGRASQVWALSPERFDQLARQHPQTALALTLALGALVAERMLDRRKRISVT